jgi:hypothetical protein
LSDAQLAGQSAQLAKENGFAGVVQLTCLAPKTHYHYTLTLEETPPDLNSCHYPEFTTFPIPGQKDSFTFAFGSCFLPDEEFDGQIFQMIEERRCQDKLQFILLNGVYLLSGDLHSAHAVSGKLGSSEGLIPIWEFCSTPFKQKPNKLSKYTFNPLPYGKLKKLHRHFVSTDSNFGVVRVNFSDEGEPQVIFEIYGKDRGRLESINTSEY